MSITFYLFQLKLPDFIWFLKYVNNFNSVTARIAKFVCFCRHSISHDLDHILQIKNKIHYGCRSPSGHFKLRITSVFIHHHVCRVRQRVVTDALFINVLHRKIKNYVKYSKSISMKDFSLFNIGRADVDLGRIIFSSLLSPCLTPLVEQTLTSEG